MQRKLLIISMDFNRTDQLLIIYSAFVKYLGKKLEYHEALHQLFIDFRSEVLYNKLFGHDFSIKLVRLTKMCLNETCSRVHVGEHLSDMFPVEKCMKQECGLRVFENRVLRRTFGPKRDEVTGMWRKPHEELNKLYQIFR